MHAPAFVLWPDGRIALANVAGRSLLAQEQDLVAECLRASLAGRDDAFHVAPISAPATPCHYLAVKRHGVADPAPRAAVARTHWGLTRRQAQVLELLALGKSNKTVAAALGCAQSTVEVHVTALFEKSGCASRSELVARFWTDAFLGSCRPSDVA
jgi:DNA-binding NarL/FixJ family response regulator